MSNMETGRASLFKGTIAVIVIYGVFVLLMTVAGFISENFRKMVFEGGFAFTVTLLSGIILVVILLLVQVLTASAADNLPREIDNLICPDYWELKRLSDEELELINNPKARELGKFYCEKPDDNQAPDVIVNSTPTKELEELKSVATQYNTITSVNGNRFTNKFTCSRLYPDYMAYVDKTIFPSEPNKVRCEYIKHCANLSSNPRIISWPGVCPAPPS